MLEVSDNGLSHDWGDGAAAMNGSYHFKDLQTYTDTHQTPSNTEENCGTNNVHGCSS